MNKKIFENARFCPKGDVEANWKRATGFIPLDKEIIIYKPDEKYSYARIKIGDGKTSVNDLPFIVDVNGDVASKEWVEEQATILGVSLQEYVNNSIVNLATEEYVDNSVAAINFPQADWNQTDENAKDFIKNKPVTPQVDQTYSAVSENAQSGIAIDSALKPIEQKNDEQDTKIAAIENKVITATKDNILSIFN